MNQKGFVPALLLLGIIFIVGVASEIYYLTVLKNPKLQPQNTVIAADSTVDPLPKSPKITQMPSSKPSADPIILWNNFTNTDFGFTFTYPKVLTVQSDSEEDYSTRNRGDARANFTNYVKYSPEKVLLAISVLGKDSLFENSIFTIWVFDNPNSLTASAWFEKYWYYPFLWGQFNHPEKKLLEPVNEASISGQIANYVRIDYQQGSPKYYYILRGNKMFLIRVLDSSDKTADDILKYFKFLNE